MAKGFRIQHLTLRRADGFNPVATVTVRSRPYPNPRICNICQIVHYAKTYHFNFDAGGACLVSAGVLDALGEAGAIQLKHPGALAASTPVFAFLKEEDDPPPIELASANDGFRVEAPQLHVDLEESDAGALQRIARKAARLKLRAEQRDVDPAERSLFIRPDGLLGKIIGANRAFDNWGNLMLGGGALALPDWDTNNMRAMLLDESDITLDTTTMQDLADLVAGLVAESANLTVAAPSGGAVDITDYAFTAVSGDAADSLIYFLETGSDATSTATFIIDTATGLPVTPNGGDINVTVHPSGAVGFV